MALSDLTNDGQVVLAFFKRTCPTCKLAFPVYGEVARRIGGSVPVVAIAQDPLADAIQFAAEFGFGGLVLDDAAGGYAVSDRYGIRSVPTVFVIDRAGAIVDVVEGWSREWTNALVARFAADLGADPSPVSTEADGRPALKPG